MKKNYNTSISLLPPPLNTPSALKKEPKIKYF